MSVPTYLLEGLVPGASPTPTSAFRWLVIMSALILCVWLAIVAVLGWWRAVGLVTGSPSLWGVVPLAVFWLTTLLTMVLSDVVTKGAGLVALLATGLFLAALGEEVAFRGFLLHGLARHLGRGGAVLAASALFAAYHLPGMVQQHLPAGDLVILLVMHFGFGVFMCRIRAETGALWFPAGVHTLWNFATIGVAIWSVPPEGVSLAVGALKVVVIAVGLIMALRLRARGPRTRGFAIRRGPATKDTLLGRLTPRARRAVVRAQVEASRANSELIETEHLLLGVIHEGGGVVAETLTALGISLERTPAPEESVAAGGRPPGPHIPFAPKVKDTLRRTVRTAAELGQAWIGPEHLLLGLLHEDEDVARRFFGRFAVPPDRLEQTILRLIAERADSGSWSVG
jgi:ATP-dependent Clp protease ATP-binding subunit ClpC